jgi:probable HAF family extracellular repeat protein
VRWTGTTPEVLGNLGGGSSSWGIAINDSGQVAGWSAKVFGGQEQAVRWTGTTPTDLGTLGGTFSSGWAINDSGQVAGYAATTNNSAIHAVRWTGTTPTDLGTLGGFNSQGFGINAFGDVIGMSMIAGDPFNGAANYAFLYTGGTMYHLLDLLVPGSGVTNLRIGGYSNGINDLGQIAAFSTINGRTYALRLDPVVPEPATAALLLVGGALLALRRRSFV